MSATPPNALDVIALEYGYRGVERAALTDLNLTIPAGAFHALLGPNGAGKTTLFSLITGLSRLQRGAVRIGEADIERQRLQALSHMGVVFQQPTLDLDLTVEQNLRYFAALNGLGAKQAKRRIAEELERFDLSARRGERIRQLNGGHRRRVEIARALLHEPRLLLFDEATVGLDVPTRQQLVDHVHRLSEEKRIAVLWTTHLIDEVYETDTVTLLDKGHVVGQGTCRDLLQARQATDLKQLFGRLAACDYADQAVAL
ncbi:ATP-binding cassette domain-containing protein [Sedimenticola sp.]|uniref:ATP-binding cassette domain-containing protein n=1 Tax=Sedimenticola sp. TaxID=1940285 RepID=UPI00258EAE2C|nr:ATP-binding cassette domain-containing protein [Sedimenticola sp.]MCW8904646.1 ATP-binding cassette domain-containing protein [Sedimenticola sp.]